MKKILELLGNLLLFVVGLWVGSLLPFLVIQIVAGVFLTQLHLVYGASCLFLIIISVGVGLKFRNSLSVPFLSFLGGITFVAACNFLLGIESYWMNIYR